MHTTYTFKKNGKAYSAKANNRFEAQEQIELAFGISLKGATLQKQTTDSKPRNRSSLPSGSALREQPSKKSTN